MAKLNMYTKKDWAVILTNDQLTKYTWKAVSWQ